MKFRDVEKVWEQLDPARLGTTEPEQLFRWYLLMFMFEIYSALDSVAYSNAEMLKLWQSRAAARPAATPASPVRPSEQQQAKRARVPTKGGL